MNSRAEHIAVGGVAVQQRATEARDPKIKAAFEDVANAGLRFAAQVARPPQVARTYLKIARRSRSAINVG
jgi:hypothetical protein